MFRTSPLLTYIAVVVALCATAFGQEDVLVPLEVPLQWQTGQIGTYDRQELALNTTAPADIDKPMGSSGDLVFATITLGVDHQLHMAFEFGERKARFWVDKDFDQSLADSEALFWQETEDYWEHELEVLVQFAGEAKAVPIPLQLRCNSYEPLTTLTYIAQVHKSGSVVLGERKRQIILRDENSQLDWSTTDGVVFVVDVDGDGLLAAGHGSHEFFYPGERFQIGAEAWTIQLHESSGASIDLLPIEVTDADAEFVFKRIWQPEPKPLPAQRIAPPETPLMELVQSFEKEKQEHLNGRTETVAQLGRVGTQEAFNTLLDIAKRDHDARLRVAAVSAMGRVEFLELGGDAVAKLAGGAQTALVEAAIVSLYRMQYPQLESVLLKRSRSEQARIVAQAALYLGYLGTAEALETVNSLLNHDKAVVRLKAYQGLRCQTAGPSLAATLVAASDKAAKLRALAILDLLARGEPEARDFALAAAEGQLLAYPDLTDAVITVLLAVGDKVTIQTVFDLAIADPRGDWVKQAVVRLSSLRSEVALDLYAKVLKSKSQEQRLLASQVFAEIGGDIAFEALSKQLKREKDRLVVESLFAGLGRSGSPDAVKVLISKAKRRGSQRLPAIAALANCGLQVPTARAFLMDLLESKYWEDRVLAIDAVGNFGERTLGSSLLPALEHESWQVRLAAVEALRKLRSADWVGPLVARLQVEERLRVQLLIGQTLFTITGQNPHMGAAAWAGWWQAASGSFHMSKGIPTPHGSGGTVSRKGFYGMSLDSDNVVFVIDKSGSMSEAAPADDYIISGGNRLDHAVANAVRSIEILGDDAMVNVVMFSSGVRTWKSSTVVLKKSNRKGLISFLDSQSPDGGTDLYDGLEAALLQEGVDRILLLSDGNPSGGKFIATNAILREVRRLNQTKRIAIDCVSIGMESPLLKRLAEENGGRYIER